MEFPSARRIRRSAPPPDGAGSGGGPDGGDRISALPEDMLLQILGRLGCSRAAARTSVLARRWRGLWARLPALTFRDVPAEAVKKALARVRPHPGVSVLDIRLARSALREAAKRDDAQAKSLLLAARRISPKDVVFFLPRSYIVKPGRRVEIAVPRFLRTTSIELDAHLLRVKLPDAELPALERLSLSGNIVDLAAFLNRCPRLRLLSVTYRDLEPSLLEAALVALKVPLGLGLIVFLLGIEFGQSHENYDVEDAQFASILHAASRLSPRELVFITDFDRCLRADLPCFPNATSITMTVRSVYFTRQMSNDQFSALERLSLMGCTVRDVSTMVYQCPCLRVLKMNADTSTRDITVHSLSLQELELVAHETQCEGINITTPILEQLKLDLCASSDLSVSVSAPILEKVSWRFAYSTLAYIFGLWFLQKLEVDTIEDYKYKDGELINEGEDACSQPHRVHVVSLHIFAHKDMGTKLNLKREIDKIPVTNFTVLELHLHAKRHAIAAFVFHLLSMHQIQTTTQRLKLVLSRWPEMSKCLKKCPCNEPMNWRNQIISLNHLEEVEIKNFRGGDHEIDFVTQMFSWAPNIKRMPISLTSEIKPTDIGGCAMSVYNICLGHPSVNSFVYLSSGERVPCSSMEGDSDRVVIGHD
ncbi:uncharacterized protein [Aegilops tauschii subsp. strangulata]|uniref:uncharacterized protein n=1 Tax=Aegilops tauschii subsp. strangulata TaxID=200361 RepID=UPI003CC861D2